MTGGRQDIGCSALLPYWKAKQDRQDPWCSSRYIHERHTSNILLPPTLVTITKIKAENHYIESFATLCVVMVER